MPDDDAATPRNAGRIYKSCKWGMIEGAASVLERFQLCKEVGFDGMELINPLDATVAEVLAASRETGMPVHGLVNIKGNRQRHIASPEKAVSEEGRRLLEESVRNCHAYGGDTVLLVPGRVGPDGTHEEIWNRSISQIRRVLPVASQLGVRILVENVWNGFCEKPEQLRDYIDEIGSPWFGSYFDIGNAQKFAPSEKWIHTLGRRIVKVDVKDWSEEKGLHGKIGDGAVNWPAVCEALGELNFTGWSTAEVKGGGQKQLADIVRRMDRVLEIK